MTDEHAMGPRRRASSDIKLLRLDLLPRGESPCEGIGVEWSPAQPTENLSPDKAAAALGIEIWAPQSVVRKRYRSLQLRYPPDQFGERHIDWRPSAELLGNPTARLNWYWQSGLVPNIASHLPAHSQPLWDQAAVEPPITASLAIARCLEELEQNATLR
jgi:hypothetical protein